MIVPAGNVYRVNLLLQRRTGRISQRAKGAWLYVIDQQGRRFAPEADPSAVPLDVVLPPYASLSTVRTFLPQGDRGIGLVTGHGGPYCGAMSFLVIGDAGCLFGKPAMVRIR